MEYEAPTAGESSSGAGASTEVKDTAPGLLELSKPSEFRLKALKQKKYVKHLKCIESLYVRLHVWFCSFLFFYLYVWFRCFLLSEIIFIVKFAYGLYSFGFCFLFHYLSIFNIMFYKSMQAKTYQKKKNKNPHLLLELLLEHIIHRVFYYFFCLWCINYNKASDKRKLLFSYSCVLCDFLIFLSVFFFIFWSSVIF